MNTKHNHHFKYLYSVLIFLIIPFLAFSQQVDSVILGYGGGFTGQVTLYNISKCIIKKGIGLTDVKYLDSARLKRSTFKKILTHSKQVRNDISGFYNPYNMYRFIEIYTDRKLTKYTWGDPNLPPPEKVDSLYNQIITIISKLKFKHK